MQVNKSAIFTAVFSVFVTGIAILQPDLLRGFLEAYSLEYIKRSEFLYLGAITLTVIAVVIFIFMPVSSFRIGGPDAKPQFSTLSWIAMIFTSTSGGALIGFSAYEPLEHFINSPFPDDPFYASPAGSIGMAIFHWGLHGWISWGVIAVIIAYYTYNRGEDFGLTGPIKQVMPDWLKDRAGTIFAVIDFFVLVSVWFGVATGLALICRQLSGGIVQVFDLGGVPHRFGPMVAIVGMAVCIIVAQMKLEEGITRIANINFVASFLVPIVILFNFDTLEILGNMFNGFAHYVVMIIRLPVEISMAVEPEQVEFRRLWPVSYIIFWFSYTTMAGGFLARISYGRSMRAILIATTFIPVGICSIWFGIIGGAVFPLLAENPELIANIDTSSSVFQLFSLYEYSMALSIFVLVLSAIFMVTTGAPTLYVLTQFTQHSIEKPKRWIVVAWGIGLGSLLALAAGSADLSALLDLSMAALTPITVIFFVVMLIAIFDFYRVEIKAKRPAP